MQVRIRDLEEFCKHGIIDKTEEGFVDIYEVEAVIIFSNGSADYLVKTNCGLQPWPSEKLEVADACIPDGWIYKRWERDLINRNYGFKSKMRHYLGPSAYIVEPDFLFDIYD